MFAGQSDGNLVALNEQTGAVVWKTSLMPWQKGGSLASAPLYYDGMVIEGTSGSDGGSLSNTMEAVNANDGEILWTLERRPAGRRGAGRQHVVIQRRAYR